MVETADTVEIPNIPPYKAREYDQVLESPRVWPIVKLNANREEFMKTVAEETLKVVKEQARSRKGLMEELESVVYMERSRVKNNRWKADPDDEEEYWGKMKGKLLEVSKQEGQAKQDAAEALLKDIIERYVGEIMGSFNYRAYRFIRRSATFFFARLLNSARIKKFGALFRGVLTLQDKINLVGETEHIRQLAKKGTVVLVPTHFSNLDSVLVGWAIMAVGLPPFIYGAGLNLFTINLLSYFMKNLGAYKVDRRKKNLVYLETLKMYSNQAIQSGCHSLFFPGGTRSRSGQIENRLKLGLLSTAITAQRQAFNEAKPGEEPKKIFVVPVVINYHFTLEAPSLIKEHLRRSGQERYYIENDEYSSSYKLGTFMLRFIRKGSDISVSFGKGMDLLGNFVDEEGNSFDRTGREIDLRDYFTSGGSLTIDRQREGEYTRMLSERIVEEYYKINRVFASHVVAFVAFRMLWRQHRDLDLFEVLRTSNDEVVFPYSDFRTEVDRIRNEIFLRHEAQELDLAPHMTWELDQLIDHGLDNVGMYHTARPLLKNKQGNITTKDLNTLYYYHNRLMGYGFEKLFGF
ncbi:MAG TPA: acyltransferase [Cytophagales bacterium]|nr:acyltransferase [Cytophagales bacterium]HAA23827.1 acyltransferase [Cytophagales bacterium]HAP63331.1 acyltransferase [Cytophagales bacterium]